MKAYLVPAQPASQHLSYIGLSCGSAWNGRTAPPRSTSEMIARLFVGPECRPLVGGGLRSFFSLIAQKVGFVGFYYSAVAAQGRNSAVPQRLWDAVRPEPSGFQDHAKSAVQLVRAYAFLGPQGR